MNETITIKIREEIKKTKETNNYENLYRYAYSNNFIIRYLFMKLLLSNNDLRIEELYEDDITRYFLRYDDNSNIIGIMSYQYVIDLAHIAISKNPIVYKQIRKFIVDAYIKRPKDIKQEKGM